MSVYQEKKGKQFRLFPPHSTQPQTIPPQEFCTPIPTGGEKNLTTTSSRPSPLDEMIRFFLSPIRRVGWDGL
jgi:hypothetical protein